MIYISHSTKFNYRELLYEAIKFSHLCKNHQFIFPHDHHKSEKFFKTKDFFLSGICKLVIAEVSLPSTGQGIELGWAEVFQIPVICLYRKDSPISSSLICVSLTFIEYVDVDDMIYQLTNILNQEFSQQNLSVSRCAEC